MGKIVYPNNKPNWCDWCKKKSKYLRYFNTTNGDKWLCISCELKLNNNTYGKVKL